MAARAFGALYGVAAAALVGLVLAVPALYLVDLPAWVYSGALLRAELADATSTPWHLAAWPVPNTLATLSPALVLGALGPEATGRALAAALLAAGFAAAWALGRAAAPDEPADAAARACVAAACLVASASFWNGYLGFQIGVVLALALAARWRRRGRLSPAGVLVASLALFLAHAVPFAVAALALGLDALARRDGRTLTALAPSAVLTAAYVAAKPPAGFAPPAGVGGPGHALAYKAYTALKLGPLTRPVRLDGTPLLDGPALAVAVAAAAVFVAVLVGALAVGTLRMPPGGPRRAALFAWAAAGASMLLPPFALNVVNPGERVLVVAAVGLLAVVPLPARVLRPLGLAALLFLADDAAALWGQRPGLAPDVRAATYAGRAAREHAAREHAAPVDARFGTAARDAAADPAERLLRHDVLLHSDLYDAARRRDWSRGGFDSGVLVPDSAALRRPSLPSRPRPASGR